MDYSTYAIFLSALLYARLAVLIVKSGGAGQNLATWISWGLLDVVATASLYPSGNWKFLAMYVVGSVFISILIWKNSDFKWGSIEITCMVLVGVSILCWVMWGASYATIISTIGVAIATTPQLHDAWFDPHAMPIDVYIGFTGVNILATLAGKEWTIEERLYPAVCVVLTLLIVIFCFKKYTTSKLPQGT